MRIPTIHVKLFALTLSIILLTPFTGAYSAFGQKDAAKTVSPTTQTIKIDAPLFILVTRTMSGGTKRSLPIHQVPDLRATDTVSVKQIPDWKAIVLFVNMETKTAANLIGHEGSFGDDKKKAAEKMKPVEFQVSPEQQAVLFLVPWKLERKPVGEKVRKNPTEFLEFAQGITVNSSKSKFEAFLINLVNSPIEDASSFKELAINLAKTQNLNLKEKCFDEKGKTKQATCLYNDVATQLIALAGGAESINVDVTSLAAVAAKEVIARMTGKYSQIVQAAILTAILVHKLLSQDNTHYYIPARMQAYQRSGSTTYTGQTAFQHTSIIRAESVPYSVLFSLIPEVAESTSIPPIELVQKDVTITDKDKSLDIKINNPENFYGSTYGHGWTIKLKDEQGAAQPAFSLSLGPNGFILPVDSKFKKLLQDKKKLVATITGQWGFEEVPETEDFTISFGQ